MKIVDISVGLDENTPTWPGSPGLQLHWYKRPVAGDDCNNTRLECDTHVGTHVDALLHFLENDSPAEKLSLKVLIGPAQVAYLPEVRTITADGLDNLVLASTTERLLLSTHNSECWAQGPTGLRKDYVSIAPEAARWLVNRGIRLVGVDYLSVGSFEEGVTTHKILLKAGVVVVEGLNLHEVHPGEYQLICLPLKLVGAEGAPARAVLVRCE